MGDDIPHYRSDAYRTLAKRHCVPFSYSLEYCQFAREYFLERHDVDDSSGSKKWVKAKDPSYVSLSSSRWLGDEFELGDELPAFAIAHPWVLSEAIQRRIPGINTHVVRTHDIPLGNSKRHIDISEQLSSVSLESPHKKIRVSKSPKSSKRGGSWSTIMRKKRKIVDEELRRIIAPNVMPE